MFVGKLHDEITELLHTIQSACGNSVKISDCRAFSSFETLPDCRAFRRRDSVLWSHNAYRRQTARKNRDIYILRSITAASGGDKT